jgi:hypothetical protein
MVKKQDCQIFSIKIQDITVSLVEEEHTLSGNWTQSFNDANTKAHEPEVVKQILTTYSSKIQLNIILPSPQFSKWLFV